MQVVNDGNVSVSFTVYVAGFESRVDQVYGAGSILK